MGEDGRGTARSDEYTYWRRYLDEDAWKPMGVDMVRRALDFLREAVRTRTPASTYEAMPV